MDLLRPALDDAALDALNRAAHPLRLTPATLALLWLNALAMRPDAAGRRTPDAAQARWRSLLNAGQAPLLQPAVDTLDEAMRRCPPDALQAAWRRLRDAARAAEGLGGDLTALLPLLSADRKEAAAFYSNPSTAELLAALTIRADDAPRHTVRIADFACGVGALLRAGRQRLRALQPKADAVLTGADINPLALHFAQCSLAAPTLAPNAPSLHLTPAGDAPHSGPGLRTGALELLASGAPMDLVDALTAPPAPAEPNSQDYVLMNPPYSRTRGGQSAFDLAELNATQRDACQDRWGWLHQNCPELPADAMPASKTAGMASSFLVIAWRMLKPGGRLGFVLPSTVAFTPAWADTRRWLREQFTDITALCAAGQDALSADTDMGEMILIAQKRRPIAGCAAVQCRTLAQAPQPNTPIEALAYALLENDGADFDGPPKAPWSAMGAQQAHIAEAAERLARHGELLQNGRATAALACGMTTCRDLFDIGPTHHLIGRPAGCRGGATEAFTMHPIRAGENARDAALWAADAAAQTRMEAAPTHAGETLPGRQAKADAMRRKTGTLHYSKGMRWTSQAVLAARTKTAVLGGTSWATLRHTNPQVLDAMTLWFNSTPGLMTHWSQAGRQQPGRAITRMAAIHGMPCPNAEGLTAQQLQRAQAHCAALLQEALQPARNAADDPVRQRIDDAVIDIFELPDAARPLIAQWRTEWPQEPSVQGRRNL